MGVSLFLVVGPVSLGELFGDGSSSSAADSLEEQAERIEKAEERTRRTNSCCCP